MIRVASLHIYPIKSCGGIRVPEIILTPHGPKCDRQFVLVDQEGKFLSQRDFKETKMCLIETDIRDETLLVRAPGMPEIGISLDSTGGSITEVALYRDTCLGFDQGDMLAEWFSDFLGHKCRLVRYSDEFPRLRESVSLGRAISVSFADAYHLLITSAESLWDLNERLKDPISMDRFRPNVVVSGCEPYEEDFWDEIEVGGVMLQGASQCVRCSITTTDQSTGERNKSTEPLRTLVTYRRSKEGALFGKYYLNLNEGVMREGDLVQVK